MLSVSELGMSAGNFSIDNISLAVPDGCCHVLLGGNGNGKTLILEAIAGLRPIKKGNIWVGDRNITNEPPENRAMSYVPQDLALFPHLTVGKNILYSQMFRKNQTRTNAEISQIIKYLHLDNILRRPIHNLSGGERQRVALARAFVTTNSVLLLDEPFSALNFTMKRSLWELLSDMKIKYNLSILLVTHDLEEACFLADYISVLFRGKLFQTGVKDEIINHPNSIEVTKMVGHYNYFPGEIVAGDGNKDCIIYIDGLSANIHAKDVGLKPGDEVVAAIKTSDIKIVDLEKDNGSYPCNIFYCSIKKKFGTSQYQQIVLKSDNHKSNIIVDIYQKDIDNFQIGQKVKVYIPTNSILVFQKNNEEI